MPAQQTVYGTNAGPPGGGNAFFAGLEELFGSPKSFAQDAVGGNSGYVPPAAPGGGSALVAGLEEGAFDPSQFAADLPAIPGLPELPSSTKITVWLVLGVVGILGVAYISHKAL